MPRKKKPKPVSIRYIAKWEGGKDGNPVLFFPEVEANRGNILCYAHMGQHSEASIEYYWSLRNPFRTYQREAVKRLLDEYQLNYIRDGEVLTEAFRDSSKMRLSRYSWLYVSSDY